MNTSYNRKFASRTRQRPQQHQQNQYETNPYRVESKIQHNNNRINGFQSAQPSRKSSISPQKVIFFHKNQQNQQNYNQDIKKKDQQQQQQQQYINSNQNQLTINNTINITSNMNPNNTMHTNETILNTQPGLDFNDPSFKLYSQPAIEQYTLDSYQKQHHHQQQYLNQGKTVQTQCSAGKQTQYKQVNARRSQSVKRRAPSCQGNYSGNDFGIINNNNKTPLRMSIQPKKGQFINNTSDVRQSLQYQQLMAKTTCNKQSQQQQQQYSGFNNNNNNNINNVNNNNINKKINNFKCNTQTTPQKYVKKQINLGTNNHFINNNNNNNIIGVTTTTTNKIQKQKNFQSQKASRKNSVTTTSHNNTNNINQNLQQNITKVIKNKEIHHQQNTKQQNQFQQQTEQNYDAYFKNTNINNNNKSNTKKNKFNQRRNTEHSKSIEMQNSQNQNNSNQNVLSTLNTNGSNLYQQNNNHIQQNITINLKNINNNNNQNQVNPVIINNKILKMQLNEKQQQNYQHAQQVINNSQHSQLEMSNRKQKQINSQDSDIQPEKFRRTNNNSQNDVTTNHTTASNQSEIDQIAIKIQNKYQNKQKYNINNTQYQQQPIINNPFQNNNHTQKKYINNNYVRTQINTQQHTEINEKIQIQKQKQQQQQQKQQLNQENNLNTNENNNIIINNNKNQKQQQLQNNQYPHQQRNQSLDTTNAKSGNKVGMQQFNMSLKIGTGSYAIVKLGVDKITGQKVAIKIYDKTVFTDKTKFNNVQREIQILQKLKHQNIIKLFHVIQTDKDVNLVMEYVGLTSLFQFLKQNSQQRLRECTVRQIFSQIAAGLDYMHKRNIVHRDIKLENLLLSDDTLEVKIIDFGFSIHAANQRKLTSFCGTPSYMAPEIINKQEYLGPPVDIWCLGVLLFVLMCGQFPFKGKDEKQLYSNIMKCQIEMPNHVPKGAKQLILDILQLDPLKRPTAEEILNNPWIRGDYESEIFSTINSEQ